MPKVTADGKSYAGVSTINVGGKSLALEQEYSGNKTISANGTNIDVSGLATVTVNVPSAGISPSGTKSITANGTYDVTQYASASVNVPTGGSGSGAMKTGVISVTAEKTYQAISTGLSQIAGFIVYKSAAPTAAATYVWCCPNVADDTGGIVVYRTADGYGGAPLGTLGSVSDGVITIHRYSSGSNIAPGYYNWIAWS